MGNEVGYPSIFDQGRVGLLEGIGPRVPLIESIRNDYGNGCLLTCDETLQKILGGEETIPLSDLGDKLVYGGILQDPDPLTFTYNANRVHLKISRDGDPTIQGRVFDLRVDTFSDFAFRYEA